MSGWKHPDVGQIDPIPTNLIPRKVWKHFLSKRENWAILSPANVDELRRDAEAIAGFKRDDWEELPKLEGAHKLELLRKTTSEQHENYYAPVYLKELSENDTWWTPKMDSLHRHHALTPRSIVVVVELGSPRSLVVTAFRPHPPLKGPPLDESKIRKHAEHYFMNRTGLTRSDFGREIARRIRQESEVPSSLMGLWWLASAVGYGRLFRDAPEVQEVLPAAEDRLSATTDELKSALRRALDWPTLERRLAEALKDDRAEDLEAFLADAEELLVIAPLVGAEQEAASLCEEAEMLLPWLPSEWAYVAERGRRLKGLAEAGECEVLRLWAAVEIAAEQALTQSAEVEREAPQFLDNLIPIDSMEDSWMHPWISRMRNFVGRASNVSRAWIDEVVNSLTFAPLAPVMGGVGDSSQEWTVRGRLGSGNIYYKVFVVDADYPEGYEVTDSFATDGELWRMSSSEQILIIVIAGERPLEGESLSALMQEAETSNDLEIGFRSRQPSQTANPSR